MPDFGPELRRWILGLEPARAVMVMRALLSAEATRTGATPGTVTMTGNIYVPDGGVDGHTDLPTDARSPFPIGPRTWQVKAGETRPSASEEVEKWGVQKDLGAGRDYVLVWTGRELTAPDKEALEEHFRSEVAKTAAERTAIMLSVLDVEAMAVMHPAVVQQQGGPRLFGLSHDQWERLFELPYFTDEARTALLEAAQQFASSGSNAVTHLHFFGDTGVGKSRLILEALRQEGLAARTVIAPRLDVVELSRLSEIVSNENASLILVVDDCTWSDAKALETYASAAQGRVRLLTIGDLPGRDVRADTRSREVPPLTQKPVEELVRQVAGIPPDSASLIAELAEGFPKLAVLLAETMGDASPPTSVAEVLQAHSVHELLSRMLPDPQAREDLQHLALFDRIGFDGELAFEADQLCDAFGLDKIRFRTSIRREEGRFVDATAGRYRRATPKAFAVWLVQNLIESRPTDFVERMAAAPEGLYDAFRRQIGLLGGHPTIEEVLRRLLDRRAELFQGADGVTPEGARLLNAVAFAVPELAATTIHQAVASMSLVQLEQVGGDTRRQLVWALQHLLWFRSTFELAADCLLALAVAENEDWANNATGVLTDAFQIQLGGTEVPFLDRMRWLEAHASDFGEKSLALAIEAAGAAFKVQEFREGGWRGSRLPPEEWRPASANDVREAVLASWRLITRVAAQHSALESKAAEVLGYGLHSVVRSGLAELVLTDLVSIPFTANSKAILSIALSEELRDYPGKADNVRAKLEAMLEQLQGESLGERTRVLLASGYWQLTRTEKDHTKWRETPKALANLATDLLASEAIEVVIDGSRPTPGVDPITVLSLYREIGLRDKAGVLGPLLFDTSSMPEARIGYLVGRVKAEGGISVDSILRRWLSDGALAEDIPYAVSLFEATPERLELALEAVRRAGLEIDSLNRLMLGRWVEPLPAKSVELLIDAYVDADPTPRRLDAAMMILRSWLERGKPTPALVNAGRLLIARAAKYSDSATGGMLGHMRDELVKQLGLEDDFVLEITLEALKQKHFPLPEDLERLTALARRRPTAVVNTVIRELLSDREGWSLYLEQSHVLSRLAESAGVGLVTESLLGLDAQERRRLVKHLDFLAEEPDPVFVSLLEATSERGLREEAELRYLFPGEVVMGPYSGYLDRRRDQLVQWASSHSSEQVREWATDLIPSLDSWIAQERLREAEEER